MRYLLVLKLVSIVTLFLNFFLSLYLFMNHYAMEDNSMTIDRGVILNLSIYGLMTLILLGNGLKRKEGLETIDIREALLIVILSWIALITIGAIPYFLHGFSTIDAIFESASGFTTTGSTIITNIEDQSRSLLMWRSTTQWIGGMGIILFFVSFVPSLKKAGPMLFRSEMPGPVKESFTPHIRHTARLLWSIYFCLTLLLVGILLVLDLTLFDAVIHAFTTLSTGGFSSYNNSVGAFSNTVQWVICLFMLLGGTNFSIYMLLFTKDRFKVFEDIEGRWYLAFILVFSIGISVYIYFNEGLPWNDAFRVGFFTIVSLVTTTGFANYDYETLSWGLQGILIITFFTGGSAGSTSGGVKFYRLVLIFKTISTEITKSISPNLVSSVKISGIIMNDKIIYRVFIFLTIYIFTVGLGMILFIVDGLDLPTAFTAAASLVGNIGPGLGTIGPSENFQHFSDFSKILGSFLMVLGRLEFFTIITVFHPQFWKDH